MEIPSSYQKNQKKKKKIKVAHNFPLAHYAKRLFTNL